MDTANSPAPFLIGQRRVLALRLAQGLAGAGAVVSLATVAVPLSAASTVWFVLLISAGVLVAAALNAFVWWSWHPIVIVQRLHIVRRVVVLTLVSPAVTLAWSLIVVVIYSMIQQVVGSFGV